MENGLVRWLIWGFVLFGYLLATYANVKHARKEIERLDERMARVTAECLAIEERTWTLALNYVIDEMNKKVEMGDVVTSDFLNLQSHFKKQKDRANKKRNERNGE